MTLECHLDIGRVLADAILLVSCILFGLQCISFADNTLEALTQYIIFISLPTIVLGYEKETDLLDSAFVTLLRNSSDGFM